MQGKTTERFLQYVQIGTSSEEDVERFPSTDSQLSFGRILAEEMKEMGISRVRQSDTGYVFGEIPATILEPRPAIGFIAHMDTAPEAPGEPVHPRIVEHYDGGCIALNDEVVLSPEKSPALVQYIGQDLVVTDGRTLLGSDDKAGIAEILTMAEYFLDNPEVPHGKILIGFTPDEEVGRGAEFFDVPDFGADAAYTVDGGTIGEIEFENFNAAEAEVKVTGFRVHPGSAKGIMKNAVTIGMEFDRMLPAEQRPEYTAGYEGYFYLMAFTGNTDEAHLQYILRDFESAGLEQKKDLMQKAADVLNCRYPGAVQLTVKDNYRNMKEQIEPHKYLIEDAKEAFLSCGIQPKIIPCRGGTDGAALSFKGLPCPNLSAGGENMHSVTEYISTRSLETMTEVLIHLAKRR
ncbi:MAG: peptidase T [Eubacterium sp.]|nr:peptidase T [Eubacterium sp.]